METEYPGKEGVIMADMVKVENVCKRFKGEQVLKNVNVNFERGKVYGIVGKNGSGKTMLFKTIIGYVRPTSGRVLVNDKEIGRDVDFAENVGIIIETPGFLSGYSAYKNLEYLASIQNRITKQQIKEAISMVGLDAESNKKVGKFSLGMKQRLGIAQAIMEKPDLLILDEPMNGLDTNGIKIVKDLLLRLKSEGKTILLASHYAEDMDLCDELYSMEAGELEKSV